MMSDIEQWDFLSNHRNHWHAECKAPLGNSIVRVSGLSCAISEPKLVGNHCFRQPTPRQHLEA